MHDRFFASLRLTPPEIPMREAPTPAVSCPNCGRPAVVSSSYEVREVDHGRPRTLRYVRAKCRGPFCVDADAFTAEVSAS